MMLSGFLVRSVPVWIAWLKYGSFMYHANSLALKIVFGNGRGVACNDAQTVRGIGSQGRARPHACFVLQLGLGLLLLLGCSLVTRPCCAFRWRTCDACVSTALPP
jgi:hypothetical protein